MTRSSTQLGLQTGPWVALGVLVALASASPASAQAPEGPVIEHIEPTSGPPGTRVNVIGRRFGTTAAVSLGSSPVTVTSTLPNRITFTIGPQTQSGLVTVATATGTTRGPEFRVTATPPPARIDAIEPSAGPPGTVVSLRGHNFSPRLTGNVVTLGPTSVLVRSATPNELSVTVPAGATSNKFLVRVAGAAEVASGIFQVTTPTTVTEVKPPRGGPGSLLTIRGSGFSKTAASNRVFLNSVPLIVKSATETELVAELPTSRVASGKLLVDVQGAGRAESPEPFVVQRPPDISDFAPKKGPPGTKIVVRGTNLGALAEAVEAKIGEAKLVVHEARDTRLTLEIPPEAKTGKLSIRVHGVGPAWSDTPFLVAEPPPAPRSPAPKLPAPPKP
jgi:hypothetical protein